MPRKRKQEPIPNDARIIEFKSGEFRPLLVSAKNIERVVIGLKPRTLRNWRSMGKGPRWFKDGQEYYSRLDDLEAYLTKDGGLSGDDFD